MHNLTLKHKEMGKMDWADIIRHFIGTAPFTQNLQLKLLCRGVYSAKRLNEHKNNELKNLKNNKTSAKIHLKTEKQGDLHF